MFLMKLGTWLTLGFLSSATIAIEASPQMSLPNCTDHCGSVSIPYPFGVSNECSMDHRYLITCNDSSLKAYTEGGNVEVLNISLAGQATLINGGYYASLCFNQYNGTTYVEEVAYTFDLNESPFWFSATENKFIVTGCDTLATINMSNSNQDFLTGCISVCSSMSSLTNGSCPGIGCCETPFPLGVKGFSVTLGNYYTYSSNWTFNPCSFALLATQDSFTFNSLDISANSLDLSNIQVAVDWAVGNQTCEEAQQDAQSYACGANSYCSNSTNGVAYLCNCKSGFDGNPYILAQGQGCQDIDECAQRHNNNCSDNAICNNTFGSYSCHCPKGYNGTGWQNGTGSGCIQDVKSPPWISIIAGVVAGLLFVFAGFCFLYWVLQKRRMIKRREKFFQQNGGLLLQQQITSRRGVTDIARIFPMEELKKATNNFEESRILGQGGYGTVFKGNLSNGKVVAIKKSKIMDKGQIIQFINEVDILSQVNHRNVVKLLGCCLETEVPLLVYEFISHGTLSEHIQNQVKSLSWGNRLRIAAETAGALAYLHSSHSIPILHRDVKSANILLDDNYTAKVADFGASRFSPLDQTQATTLVQGTLGYLDPECFHTGQLIDKSDVYSFGIVLAELLTGKKPILSEGSEEHKSLAILLVSSVKDNKLFQILDDQIVNEGDKEQLVAVSELARRCLKVKGEDRPTMKEVAMELDSLIMSYKHPWIKHNQDDRESLLGETPSTSSTVNATCQQSFGDSFVLPLHISAR